MHFSVGLNVVTSQLEKVKMAALDDSLTHFEGQKWSLWAERLGLSSPASECDYLNVRWWCPGSRGWRGNKN